MTDTTPHIDTVQEHFGRQSKTWYELYREPKCAHDLVLQDRTDFSVRFIAEQLSPGSNVLDAGCGAGVASFELVKRGFTVHGIDIAAEMIDICNEHFVANGIDAASYSFTAGDVLKSGLPEHSFDGILALGFLEYQTDTDEIGALRAFHRLLKPGGVLVVTGPIKTTIAGLFGITKTYRGIKRGFKRLAGSELEPVLSAHRYSRKRFRTLLEASGYTVTDHKRHGFANFHVPSRLKWSKLWQAAEYPLHRSLTRISRLVPIDRFANDIIVVAKA